MFSLIINSHRINWNSLFQTGKNIQNLESWFSMDKKKKYMWIIVIIDDVFKEEMINIYDNICNLIINIFTYIELTLI